MAITVENTSNCRLIDRRALGTGERLREPAKLLLDIMDLACCDGLAAGQLSQYQLSRLLWASQALRNAALRVSVYVTAPDGLYRFDADTCFLKHVVRGELRAFVTAAGMPGNAPTCLLYVADLDGLPRLDVRQQELAAAIWVGQCSQNVTLMCVAEGLPTQVRVINDAGALADLLALQDNQRLLLAQAIGSTVGDGIQHLRASSRLARAKAGCRGQPARESAAPG